jgi:hypothetical protein
MTFTEMRIRITLIDELLGTASGNPDLYGEYIASKAPKEELMNEEIEDFDADAMVDKAMTGFPRDEKQQPFLYDYQIRGFFKEACKFLKKVSDTKSSKEKAYKQKIDGCIFVKDRQNVINVNGDIGICERSLRASTPQGDRIALSRSESVPEGSSVTFTVQCLIKSDLDLVDEWMEYGRLHGTGQWRNAGKGRFEFEVVK